MGDLPRRSPALCRGDSNDRRERKALHSLAAALSDWSDGAANCDAAAMRRVDIDDDDLELAERALRGLAHRYRQDAKRTKIPDSRWVRGARETLQADTAISQPSDRLRTDPAEVYRSFDSLFSQESHRYFRIALLTGR